MPPAKDLSGFGICAIGLLANRHRRPGSMLSRTSTATRGLRATFRLRFPAVAPRRIGTLGTGRGFQARLPRSRRCHGRRRNRAGTQPAASGRLTNEPVRVGQQVQQTRHVFSLRLFMQGFTRGDLPIYVESGDISADGQPLLIIQLFAPANATWRARPGAGVMPPERQST